MEIGPIAKPKEIRLGDTTKDASGKIMRRLLRALAKGEEIQQDVSTLETLLSWNNLVGSNIGEVDEGLSRTFGKRV